MAPTDAKPFMVTPARDRHARSRWPTPSATRRRRSASATSSPSPSNPEGWASKGHPEWGAFKLGKTNPNFSTSGLSATIAQYYAATGKQSDLTLEDLNRPDVDAFMRGVESLGRPLRRHHADVPQRPLPQRPRRASASRTSRPSPSRRSRSSTTTPATPTASSTPASSPASPACRSSPSTRRTARSSRDNPFFVLDAPLGDAGPEEGGPAPSRRSCSARRTSARC